MYILCKVLLKLLLSREQLFKGTTTTSTLEYEYTHTQVGITWRDWLVMDNPPPVGSDLDRDLTEFTYLLVTVHVYIGMAQHSSILRTNKYDAIDIHIVVVSVSRCRYFYFYISILIQAGRPENMFFFAHICHGITDPPFTKIRLWASFGV